MCVVPSLPLVLSFFHKKTFPWYVKTTSKFVKLFSLHNFLFRFKLFEERVVKGSRVFVNEQVPVHFHIIDAQLFFARNKNTLNL